MDKLVAQYSRPAHQNEFYSEQEQQDLNESLPPLSLKFSMPPIDNVSFCPVQRRRGLSPVSDGNATEIPCPARLPNPDSSSDAAKEAPSNQQSRPPSPIMNLKLMIFSPGDLVCFFPPRYDR